MNDKPPYSFYYNSNIAHCMRLPMYVHCITHIHKNIRKTIFDAFFYKFYMFFVSFLSSLISFTLFYETNFIHRCVMSSFFSTFFELKYCYWCCCCSCYVVFEQTTIDPIHSKKYKNNTNIMHRWLFRYTNII